jgi:hypothetical protein
MIPGSLLIFLALVACAAEPELPLGDNALKESRTETTLMAADLQPWL